MAGLISPINFQKWIDDNRHLLKPPVGNKVVWQDGDMIIMVVGGPNSRKDFHYNETPEFFYQIEGDIVLRVIDEGKQVDIHIKEGEIFLLPPRIPHSPQREANTVGLVIELLRPEGVLDAFQWYCESCDEKIYEKKFQLKDIVKDMPIIFDKYYADESNRTCQSCGFVMVPPKKL